MKLPLWLLALLVLSGSVCGAAEPQAPAAKGNVQIDVTDTLGRNLPARVEFRSDKDSRFVEIPSGHGLAQLPDGQYKAYVYAYVLGVPVLVDVKEIQVKGKDAQYILVNLLEGSGSRPLFDFDRDCDFALDNVELSQGTNPDDAGSIPGKEPLPFNDAVLAQGENWYRGELHCHSSYGIGKESVKQLVARGEKEGLDFLAITDRNTMKAAKDPGFKSKSMVLIPAMEWGDDKKGVALLYGPRTFPELTDSRAQAQALVDLVQAQGGFFAVGNPCFPGKAWQWGLSYVNGVEVWCRDWSGVPPISLEQLSEDLGERKDGKLVHSIAYAAASKGLSANGQASIFYDAELVRGLKAGAIGGSGSASPGVPLGAPVTYVYATEKSVKGILDGLRRGRTYISSGLKGPKVRFGADVMKDGTIDVSLGGVIPIGVPTMLEVSVENAEGKELQILLNGRPLISKTIESNAFAMQFEDTPVNYAVYRVRVIGKPDVDTFGSVEVFAFTSPIYAQDVDVSDPKIKEMKEKTKKKLLEDKAPEVQLPSTPGAGEIKPKWTF